MSGLVFKFRLYRVAATAYRYGMNASPARARRPRKATTHSERSGRPPLARRLATTVRMLMAREQMNQTGLGDILGITQSAASKKLNGATFDLDDVEALAAYFRVDPVDMLRGIVSPERPGPEGEPMSRPTPINRRARHDSNVQPSDPKVIGYAVRAVLPCSDAAA